MQPFSPFFYSGLNRLDDPPLQLPLLVRVICFIQSTDPNASLFWKTPSQSHPDIMLNQLSGHPVAQST